jgi:peptide/nickel transport system permease protein
MREYIIRRLLQIIPTILAITLVVFAMMQAIPGDPIIALLGDAYDEDDAEVLREEYGLNKPIVVQYGIWLMKVVQGDWGKAIISGREVLNDVLIRLPLTIELIVLAMVVALLIAIPAGIIAAVRQNTWGDYTAMSTAMIGISVPDFFLGILLLLFFSFFLKGLLPSSGWVYLPGTCPSLVCEASFWGNIKHVIMPALLQAWVALQS